MVNAFFCFINHQLKLVVNRKIVNCNRFIGFQIFDAFSNIFLNYTLFRVNSTFKINNFVTTSDWTSVIAESDLEFSMKERKGSI